MSSNVRLWYHWVLANAFAEVVGLGLVGFIGWLMFGAIGERSTATVVLAFATFTVALGALEGTVVGWAQSLVIRERLSGFEGWVQATVVGALVAWFVGMIPSTVINLMPHDQAELSPSISQSIRMLLAVGLGFVAGPLLAVFQYRILCRYVGRAGWWLLANALAWAVGMPVVFAGLHVAYIALSNLGWSVALLSAPWRLQAQLSAAFMASSWFICCGPKISCVFLFVAPSSHWRPMNSNLDAV